MQDDAPLYNPLEDRPLGVMGIMLIKRNTDAVKYRVGEFQLEQGDTLVAYTDGVTDAVSPAGHSFTLNHIWAVPSCLMMSRY